jgi:hypothetical protein
MSSAPWRIWKRQDGRASSQAPWMVQQRVIDSDNDFSEEWRIHSVHLTWKGAIDALLTVEQEQPTTHRTYSQEDIT